MTAYKALYDIMPCATLLAGQAALDAGINNHEFSCADSCTVVSDTVDSWAQSSQYALKPFLNLHLHSQPALYVVYILYYTVLTSPYPRLQVKKVFGHAHS